MKKLLFCQSLLIAICVQSATGISVPKGERQSSKKELGKTLFFDPRLSLDGTVSCNSCHNLMGSGTDQRPHSIGVGGKHGDRKSPTVWNVALMSSFFWDGSAKTLEEQATGPMTNPVEMAMPNLKAVVDRVKGIEGYEKLFKEAFGTKEVTIDKIASAIADFERTLVVKNSRFDKYQAGDKKALTDQEVRGFKLTQNIGCNSCHSGDNFSGPKLPQGQAFLMKFPLIPDAKLDKKYSFNKDTGRHKFTGKTEDKHMWRVPTWRNVALTAPYFHNGSVASLKEAVKIMAKTQLGKELSDVEANDITAFLESLTSDLPQIAAPKLPISKGQAVKF